MASEPEPEPVDVNAELVRQLTERVSGLRDQGFAGALPLFVDRAFDDIPSNLLFDVLTAVKNLSAAVQVVLLTDRVEIVDWAGILTPEQARCSVIEVAVPA